ncbi:MAG: hypothetical protein R3E66_04450 [bacterium]
MRSKSTREPPLRKLAAVGETARSMIAGVSSWVANRTWSAVFVVVVAVVTTSLVAFALLPKMEYLPTGNRNLIFGIILPPPGYSVDESIRIGHGNQEVMVKHTGESVDGVPAIRRSFFVGDPSLFIAGGVAQNPDEIRGLRDFMQALHGRIPGVINFASQSSLFAGGIGEGRAVEIELSGPDLNALIGVGRKLMGSVSKAVPNSCATRAGARRGRTRAARHPASRRGRGAWRGVERAGVRRRHLH